MVQKVYSRYYTLIVTISLKGKLVTKMEIKASLIPPLHHNEELRYQLKSKDDYLTCHTALKDRVFLLQNVSSLCNLSATISNAYETSDITWGRGRGGLFIHIALNTGMPCSMHIF